MYEWWVLLWYKNPRYICNKMNCQGCNFHMHVTYIICHLVMYSSLRIQAMQQYKYIIVVSDFMLYMWLSYVCNFCNWCVINSHEQNIQFLHDSLQEQLEHDFGHVYFFGGELFFPIVFCLFCARVIVIYITILHRFTWVVC